MGYKLADIASKRKHSVILISGPAKFVCPKVKKFISIETTRELFNAVRKELKNADCLIMCAAVGDFRAENIAKRKIKRTKRLLLKLVPNRDILKEIARYKKDKLFIGFSLETEDLIGNSYKKLQAKKLDLIVGNVLAKDSNIFGDSKLDVCIIDRKGSVTKIKRKNKPFIANVLLDKIEEM